MTPKGDHVETCRGTSYRQLTRACQRAPGYHIKPQPPFLFSNLKQTPTHYHITALPCIPCVLHFMAFPTRPPSRFSHLQPSIISANILTLFVSVLTVPDRHASSAVVEFGCFLNGAQFDWIWQDLGSSGKIGGQLSKGKNLSCNNVRLDNTCYSQPLYILKHRIVTGKTALWRMKILNVKYYVCTK